MGYDRVIVWRITQRCNMNCLFCSYSGELCRQRDDASAADIERMAEVFGAYQTQNSKKLLVSWIGGEPLLYKDIYRLSALMHRQGLDVSATTNGLLLDTAQKRQQILDNFSEIVFSLDGFAPCHDRVRRQPGAFDKVCRSIAALDEQKRQSGGNTVIKVNTILMRENIGYFEEFCLQLAELGVNELTFNQLGGFDRPEFYDDNRLLAQQTREFARKLPAVRASCAALGLVIHGGEGYLQRIESSTNNSRISVDECKPGRWFWFINENGYISPCSYTSYEYKLPLASIRKPEDIDAAEGYFRALRADNRSHWCDDCHCTQNYDKFD